MAVFEFIKREEASYEVWVMCRLLKVSASERPNDAPAQAITPQTQVVV